MGNDHHSHSSMVRFWRPKDQLNAFGVDWKEGEIFVLHSPHDGYRVSVSFSKYPDHPEYTRVRSTNWRCEHEPNNIFKTQDARRFFADLLLAGFVRDYEIEKRIKSAS